MIKVIGRKKPVGICGSGVLDALATLRRAGILDGRGRLNGAHPAVGEHNGQRVAQLAEGVGFSQADVRAVQLAKSAVRTGVDLLLRRAAVQEAEVDQCIIAGTFGAYLGVKSGVETGLLPALPSTSFVQVGNAAGLGIQRMLASQRMRREAAELAARCCYVELSTMTGFEKSFL